MRLNQRLLRRKMVMKKVLKVLSLVMVAAMLCITLASCGKTLSGKYENDATVFSTGVVTTYEFSGKKVTLTVESKAAGATVGDPLVIEGKYSIDDDKITFEFEGDDEDAKKYSQTLDFEESEDYIKIGVVKFEKK